MTAQFPLINDSSPEAFLSRASTELHRAERYRVFISLTVLDLEFAKEQIGNGFGKCVQKLRGLVGEAIRDCDYMTVLGDSRLALMFPETSRQGAEVAIRRLGELVREVMTDLAPSPVKEVIPVEMVSFPDTAGAKTLAGFLEELAGSSQN